jgi:hypothetical protein
MVTIAMHFNEVVLPLVVSDGLCLLIKDPLLSELDTIIPSSLE